MQEQKVGETQVRGEERAVTLITSAALNGPLRSQTEHSVMTEECLQDYFLLIYHYKAHDTDCRIVENHSIRTFTLLYLFYIVIITLYFSNCTC